MSLINANMFKYLKETVWAVKFWMSNFYFIPLKPHMIPHT